MASDNQANYARIGGFIIVGIALIVATLVWLGGVGGKDSEFLVETFFPNDVTGLDVKAGDTVTVFGDDPTVGEIADILGTIPYEILTSVPRRIESIIVK